MSQKYIRILSIAGSDSGGGAGIQADLKTIAALGGYGMTAITAVTCQNTVGVQNIYPLPAKATAEQIESIMSDIGVDAIKIGMLHSKKIVETVVNAIKKYSPPYVVVDPVMVAASGDQLIEDDTIAMIVEQLFPLADVVTPNLFEARIIAKLLGKESATTKTDKESDQQLLISLGKQIYPSLALALGLDSDCGGVLIKGGHIHSEQIYDIFMISAKRGKPDILPTYAGFVQSTDTMQINETKKVDVYSWQHQRLDTKNTHGSGCTLSTAIAVYLAKKQNIVAAVANAGFYVHGALKAGQLAKLGQGSGPLNHGFSPQKTILHEL